MKLEDKQKRKESRDNTRLKRELQVCKVFELKLDVSHLSKDKKEYLNRLFLEAKWFYNYLLSSEDIFKFNDKVKEVCILNKDKQLESRELKFLTAQMKQDLKQKCFSSIKMFSSKKKQKNKVGKLKFKSRVCSVPLRQFGITYRIENKNYVFIQGFKKHFKVLGLDQIPEQAELANANLVRKPSGYYLKVTCFVPKEQKLESGKSIGLDFGIKDNITDSNGNKYNFYFQESKQLKKVSRKLNRCKNGSSNRYRTKLQLQKQYEKLTNKKKDKKNKFVSNLIKSHDVVVIQDENLKAWHQSKMKGWGRKIQYSIMGGIISELKKYSETLVIDRWFPSTQLCPQCGTLNKPSLDKRIYVCVCGYQEDRDVHSARNILREGFKKLCREPIQSPLDEEKASIGNVSPVSSYLMTPEATALQGVVAHLKRR